jgi:hypothetical protein
MRRQSLSSIGCGVVIIGVIAVGAIGAFMDEGSPTPTEGAVATLTPAPWTEEPEPSVAPEPTPMVVGLREALADGLVEMEATGLNLQELQIELASNVELSLEVTIEAGTLFVPGASGTQNMVVLTDTYLQIEPELSVEWDLDVACASMNKDTPGRDDRFQLSEKPAKADLRRLVDLDAFATADFRVQQFAVWTITNNPSRNGYVGLGIGGAGSGPTNAEIRQIRALFAEAGIDASQYRAL